MVNKALKLALEALTYCEALNRDVERQKMQAITAIKESLAQPEHGHAEQMAKLGWQYFECPACGSEGARAFPKTESAYQRGYLDGIGRECPHCKDYRAMYIKVRDELAAEQQVTQRQTARIVDLQAHIANLEGEE